MSLIPAPWKIEVVSDLVMMGRDSEMADMGNPEGYRFAERWVIQAEDRDGRRKVYSGISFEDSEEAIRFATNMTGWDPELSPIEGWNDRMPRYGSPAYLDEDVEADLIDMEMGHYPENRSIYDSF